MDEENQGPQVRKKRISSILKPPLTGIDPNTQIKEHDIKKKRRSSKRVSFSETLGVREFKTSECVNAEKNVFQSDDKEIAGLDSLLTGKIIKNPTPVVENISDPEDNSYEEAAILNCSVYQSEEMDIMHNFPSNVKTNINFVSSPNSLSPADVSPANQSMYCSPDLDNTPQKLDNKIFFQQLMQKLKNSPSLSPDDSPVMTVACRPSVSTKMFLENLLQDTKFNQSSFSPEILSSKEIFPDDAMETSNGISPVFDKPHHNQSCEPIDTTIHFNFNSDQAAGMDFTMCNSKLFSDSFKLENLADLKQESPLNVTRCFVNMDDTNANMELTACTGNLMAPGNFCVPKETSIPQNTTSPKSGEITVYFGSDDMSDADIELTKCHGKLLSDCSRIELKDENDMKQKLTSHEDQIKIFNETKDTIVDIKMKRGTSESTSSFLDRASKPKCEIVSKENKMNINKESKSRDGNLVTNMELTLSAAANISMYPTCTKNALPNEDGKENVVPFMLSHNADEMQIEEIKSKSSEINILEINQKDTQKLQGNCAHNLEDDKQIDTTKEGFGGLTERNFMELSAKKTNQISDVVNTSSTKPVKKTLKRVSFKCPEEEPRNKVCPMDEDDPPMKKLCSNNQVDLHDQQSGSTDVQHWFSIQNQCENNASFTDVIMKKKSGVKRVSFYEPEEVRNLISEESFNEKIVLENGTNKFGMESTTVYQEKPSQKISASESERNSFTKANSNIVCDIHSQETTANSNHDESKSAKQLYISMNTSGIVKSFNEPKLKSESINENIQDPMEKQSSSFIVCKDEESLTKELDKHSNFPVNPVSKATENSLDIDSKSQDCLNRYGALVTLSSKNHIESEPVDKGLSKISEKRISSYPIDDRPSEKEDISSSNADPQSTTNKCLYISANSSGILKSFVNSDDCSDDKTVNKDLIKTGTKLLVASTNEQLLENNTLARTSLTAKPEKSCESNKYLYISSNTSGSIKSFSLDEKYLDGQQVDQNLNKSVKMNKATFSPKPCTVDEGQLSTCVVVSTKPIAEKQEPISLHCDHEPFDNKLVKSVSHVEKTFPANVSGEDSSLKEKETTARVDDEVNQPIVAPVANQLDNTHKHERLSTVPNFRTSWQGMFSIDNVIKNVRQSRSRSISVTSCEPTRKAASVSAVNIMQHTVSNLEKSEQPFLKVPSQDKISNVANEKAKYACADQVVNKCTSELKTIGMKPIVDSILPSSASGKHLHHTTIEQLSSHNINDQNVKISSPSEALKCESSKPGKKLSVDEEDFQLEEELSGIMSEKCDILIDTSQNEDPTAHVSQSHLSSMLHSNRPSFSNKSLDTLSTTLCSRMLSNVYSASLGNKLSAFEAESIDELLAFIGISKLDNFTIDDSVHFSTPEFEVMTLKEKLIMSFLEEPKYQTLFKTYESLKADENKLLIDYQSKKLLKDFQFVLKQKESYKSTDELKNELIDNFKKIRQLSHQKIKERKIERYRDLCTVLKNNVVILEAKLQMNDVFGKLDEQIESLDEDISTLDKELDYLQSLPEPTDEYCYQYTQVVKYLDVVHKVELQEQKLSNTCCQLMEQEKLSKEKLSSLNQFYTSLLKSPPLNFSALLKNCQKLKIYSVLFPWRVWQLTDDRQKYNFWNDTFQLCIHTRAELIEKAHFQLDENWQSVVKYEPWLEIAHEMRQELQESTFLDVVQISQLPMLLDRLGTLLNSFGDLAKEIHAVSLKNVIKRQKNSILVTYCSSAHLCKIQVRFQFDPINYPTAVISHEINLLYGNVRCEDINRKLQKVKPGMLYLSRLVNAVQLVSVSTPW